MKKLICLILVLALLSAFAMPCFAEGDDGENDPFSWSDIVKCSYDYRLMPYMLGLDAKGKIHIANPLGEIEHEAFAKELRSLRGVKDYYLSYDFFAPVMSDGTVRIYNTELRKDKPAFRYKPLSESVTELKDVERIELVSDSISGQAILALHRDSTLSFVANRRLSYMDFSGWDNIKELCSFSGGVIGIRTDGSCVSTGRAFLETKDSPNYLGDPSTWEDVEMVYAAPSLHGMKLYVLKNDGTLLLGGTKKLFDDIESAYYDRSRQHIYALSIDGTAYSYCPDGCTEAERENVKAIGVSGMAIGTDGRIMSDKLSYTSYADLKGTSPVDVELRSIFATFKLSERYAYFALGEDGRIYLVNSGFTPAAMDENEPMTWTNIVKADCDQKYIVALDAKGKMHIAPHGDSSNEEFLKLVRSLEGVKAYCLRNDFLAALNFDGTVSICTTNDDSAGLQRIMSEDAERLKGVKSIALVSSLAGSPRELVALHEDGTVTACGTYIHHDFSAWQNIKELCALPDGVIGIRNDGSCVATGAAFEEDREFVFANLGDPSTWRNVKSICSAACPWGIELFILKNDGTLLRNDKEKILDNIDSLYFDTEENHLYAMTKDGKCSSYCSSCSDKSERTNIKTVGYYGMAVDRDGNVISKDGMTNYQVFSKDSDSPIKNPRLRAIIGMSKSDSDSFYYALGEDGRMYQLKSRQAGDEGEDTPSDWSDIVKCRYVEGNYLEALIGLDSEGKMHISSFGGREDNEELFREIGHLTGVKDFHAGRNEIFIVKNDGRVLVYSTRDYLSEEMTKIYETVPSLKNVDSIDVVSDLSANVVALAALHKDGTVSLCGGMSSEQVRHWSNIKTLCGLPFGLIGIKSDGSCLGVGETFETEKPFLRETIGKPENWKDVKQINDAVCPWGVELFILTNDGTVYHNDSEKIFDNIEYMYFDPYSYHTYVINYDKDCYMYCSDICKEPERANVKSVGYYGMAVDCEGNIVPKSADQKYEIFADLEGRQKCTPELKLIINKYYNDGISGYLALGEDGKIYLVREAE